MGIQQGPTPCKGKLYADLRQPARSLTCRLCSQHDDWKRPCCRGCHDQDDAGRKQCTRIQGNGRCPAAQTYVEFGPYQERSDRWQIGEYIYPSYFYINNGCAAANSGNGDDSKLDTAGEWGFQVYHGLPPPPRKPKRRHTSSGSSPTIWR